MLIVYIFTASGWSLLLRCSRCFIGERSKIQDIEDAPLDCEVAKLVQRYNSAAAEFSINNDPNNNATSKFRFRARHDRFAKSRATRYWHSIYSTLLKLSGRLINLSKLNSFSDFANGNLLLSDEHNAIGIHARRDARNNNIISEVIRQKRPTIAWNRTSRFWRHENL